MEKTQKKDGKTKRRMGKRGEISKVSLTAKSKEWGKEDTTTKFIAYKRPVDSEQV